METIKKRIQQKTMLVLSGITGHTIVNDTGATYYIKIGLVSTVKDVGFLDAYVESVVVVPPVPPIPPTETNYYLDYDNGVFTDSDGGKFLWE